MPRFARTIIRMLLPALLFSLNLSRAQAQQASTPAPNRLVTGKMIYVAPMPNNLDKWLQEDLRVWGRYRVTSNPEGVDLEITAAVPERQTQYRERHGVPLPKKEPKKSPKETSIDVVDWTSGARLWSAAILDKRPDPNSPPPAAGSTLEIPARDVTPDQLALKITDELRRYVEQLDSSAPGQK